MHLDLSLLQQVRGQTPERLSKLKVLRLSRDFIRTKAKRLSEDRVAERGLPLDLVVDGLDLVFWDGEESAVSAAGGGHGRDCDFGAGAFGDAVECVGYLVLRPFADFLGAGLGGVVEYSIYMSLS